MLESHDLKRLFDNVLRVVDRNRDCPTLLVIVGSKIASFGKSNVKTKNTKRVG